MSDKMREEFEAALLSEKCASGDELVKADWIARGSDGEYRSYFVRGAWWAWQASRAALEIELPDNARMYFNGAPASAYSDGVKCWHDGVDSARTAIHAAGVKTK